MSHRYQAELRLALDAVTQAARVCRSVQSTITPDVLEKKDRSPVTVADFASQAVICRMLEQHFPNDPVIGEEDAQELRNAENAPFLEAVSRELRSLEIEGSPDEICHWIDHGGASDYSDRFWTLDPIDGTKGFLRGGQYAIALALIVNGQVDLGVLGCPNLPIDADTAHSSGTLFFAVRGQGSHTVSFDQSGEPKRIAVSLTEQTSLAKFCESVESGHSAHDRSAHVADKLQVSRDPMRLDSQAKYAVVARGEAEIYMRLPTRANYQEKIWDHAGGVLIVEEAGGTVTDMTGKPLEFHHGRTLAANTGVIATNGVFHERVLTALQSVNVG